MHFQIEVGPPVGAVVPAAPPPPPDSPGEMLRQLVELSKQQVMMLRALYAQHDNNTRWKMMLERWHEDFPRVGDACRETIPAVEKAYLRLVEEMTDRLRDDEDDPALEDDFSLSEFLDRYAVRISQLGTMLNLIGPLADAARRQEKNDQ